MPGIFGSIDTWHQSKPGLAIFGAVELLGAAAFVWWATHDGNWLDWLCAIVLAVGALQNFVRLSAGGGPEKR